MIHRGLQEAVRCLKRGEVVIYPTETAYAVGADATNPAAVRTVFRLKGRIAKKSLPLIVGSMEAGERIAKFSPLARKLGRVHWPGPLTLVLPVRQGAKLASGVISRGTIAVRVSSHPVAAALARRLRKPLVSTSANRAGKPSCYSVSAIKKQLGKLPDTIFILDGGVLPHRAPSTIARIGRDRVELIRQGSIRL